MVAPGDRATAAALAPLAWGEAPQIGLLGDTGTGKTTAALAIVAAYLRASPGCVLVADNKGEGRFQGQRYTSTDELADRRPIAEPRVVVFRADPFAGQEFDPETMAALQWRMAARRVPTLGVYDELGAACNYGQWAAGRRSVLKKTFGQGRAVGIATLWGAQSPQDVPREPFEQSSCILCFRLAGLGLAKLAERNYLNGGAGEVIETLPGMDDPPSERGLFVLLRRGRPWDQTFYRYR